MFCIQQRCIHTRWGWVAKCSGKNFCPSGTKLCDSLSGLHFQLAWTILDVFQKKVQSSTYRRQTPPTLRPLTPPPPSLGSFLICSITGLFKFSSVALCARNLFFTKNPSKGSRVALLWIFHLERCLLVSQCWYKAVVRTEEPFVTK